MKFKINQKGNFVLLEVEQIVEAYGWNDSKTCYVEWYDTVKYKLGQETLTKRSTMVYAPIKSVIHKIEKERATKGIYRGRRDGFSRFKV